MSDVYGMEKLRRLMEDDVFLQELKWQQNLNDYYYAFRARDLGERFGVKSWLYPILERLIETGEFEPRLAIEPVSIEVDRVKSRGLKLVLAEDISQVELKRYITESWKDIIQPQLQGLAKGRETNSLYPDRDKAIYEDYLNRKSLGLTITAIALRNNTSTRTVNRVIHDKKKSF